MRESDGDNALAGYVATPGKPWHRVRREDYLRVFDAVATKIDSFGRISCAPSRRVYFLNERGLRILDLLVGGKGLTKAEEQAADNYAEETRRSRDWSEWCSRK